MRTTHPRTGNVAKAAMLAGPILLIHHTLFSWMLHPDLVAPMPDSAVIPLILFALLISIPFGFLVAIVPCAIGAWFMAMLGRTNDGMRLPLAWAIVGGAVGSVPYWITGATTMDAGVLACIATSASCALICRSGTGWNDDLESPVSAAAPMIVRPQEDFVFLQRRHFLR